MTRDFGQGMFTMPEITAISNMATLAEAKEAAYAIIMASTANADNKTKARAMVAKAMSLKSLLLGMSNFSLSHMGLATI